MGLASLAQAASVYWDINGNVAGATSDAGGVADGIWSTSAVNWSTNSGGGLATIAWAANDSALFSAGTNATGASTITLSGAQSAGIITVDEGSIILTGDALSTTGTSLIKSTLTLNNAFTSATASNVFDVSTGGLSGRLNIGSTGSLTAASASLRVGVNATASTSTAGAVYQSGASVVSVNNVTMGTTANGGVSSSYYRVAGTSTLNAANTLAVGVTTGASGHFFDQTGGSVTVGTGAGGYVRLGSGGTTGVMNITGGSFAFNGPGTTNDNSFVVAYGASSRGELNVAGTGSLNLGTTLLRVAGNGTATGIVNLGTGGTIAAARVIDGGTSTLNFSGGTLQATASTVSTNYFLITDNAYVYSGGARIDSNGFNVTIAQSLQAPAGDGVQSVTVSNGGSGYVGAPVVSITGGGGSGATGYAVMDSTGTQVVSIVITNPGTGYTSAPTITLLGGGGSGTVLGTASLAANTSGALTKIGSGVLTLTAVNTYAGGTFINAGGITAGASGTFGSGNVTVASGASLTLGNAASIADTALLFFSEGASITFASGTESLGNIVLGSTGIVASGLYSASDLNTYFGLTGGNEVFFGSGFYNVAASAIPEPSALALIAGIASVGACALRRRRR